MSSRILVVRFSALGDVVLLTVLLRALRTRFASATIDVVTRDTFAPLLDTHPATNDVIAFPRNGNVRQLSRELNSRAYDVKIDAHGSLRSRTLRQFMPGPWHVVHKDRWGRFVNIWTARASTLMPIAEQYIAAVSVLGVQADGSPPDLHVDARDRENAQRVATGEYVVLAPGAQHATKRWPATHWRALAARLNARGIRMVGTGLPHEASVLADTPVADAYNLPVRSMIAMVAGAKTVVAHDSGITHVASAVGVPVVTIYGPTDPKLGYAAYKAESKAVSTSIGCRPCSVFGDPRCPAGHHECMNELSPTTVADALEAFL